MEKYAQHIEIKIEDMDCILRGLMKSGYECRVSQDGESMEVVTIDYLNPKWDGHNFVESEE